MRKRGAGGGGAAQHQRAMTSAVSKEGTLGRGQRLGGLKVQDRHAERPTG